MRARSNSRPRTLARNVGESGRYKKPSRSSFITDADGMSGSRDRPRGKKKIFAALPSSPLSLSRCSINNADEF